MNTKLKIFEKKMSVLKKCTRSLQIRTMNFQRVFAQAVAVFFFMLNISPALSQRDGPENEGTYMLNNEGTNSRGWVVNLGNENYGQNTFLTLNRRDNSISSSFKAWNLINYGTSLRWLYDTSTSDFGSEVMNLQSNGDLSIIGNLTLTGSTRGIVSANEFNGMTGLFDDIKVGIGKITVGLLINEIADAERLEVDGNIKSRSNIIAAGSFIGDGSQLTGVQANSLVNNIAINTSGSLSVQGTITGDTLVADTMSVGNRGLYSAGDITLDAGARFIGDGSQLTGISAASLSDNLSINTSGSFTATGGSRIMIGSTPQPSPDIFDYTNVRNGLYFSLNNVSYGIYMARQGSTNSAEMSASTGGYNFNGDALRFRVFDNSNHGFIWENDNNELLMSLSADTGQLYVNADIITNHVKAEMMTNQTMVTDTLSVGNQGIYSAGDIKLNAGARFIGDGSQLTGISTGSLSDNLSINTSGSFTATGGSRIMIGSTSQPSPDIFDYTNVRNGLYFSLNNVSYGIYMARQGSTNSAEMSASTGGYNFNGDALRFRVFDNSNHGFIWENDNNELLMSLSADTGQLYVNADIITNQKLIANTINVGNQGIYSAGDIKLNESARFVGSRIMIGSAQQSGIDVFDHTKVQNGLYFMPNNVSYGIYMARQGSTNSADMSSSTAGYNFTGDALRFRVFDNGNHGFIWENDNNELLMSLRADTGQLYVNAGIITNQATVADTLSVGDRGIYSAGDIKLNAGARFIGDGSQLTNIPSSSPWNQSENKLSFLGTNNQIVVGNLHPNVEAGFTGAAVTVGGGMVITNDSIDTQLAGLFPPGQDPMLAVDDLPNYNLWVEDGIMSEMFWVVHPCIWDGDNSDCPDEWGDYVFDEAYELSPLEEVKDYITANKHLPGIPSTEEVMRGYELHDMNKKFIVKIEELMLYIIAQEEKIKQLTEKEQKVEQKMDALSKEIELLKKLIDQ
ncbi:MAG: hypothetical protein AAF620_05965 [Bacteroidota bacterium]